MRPAVRFGVLCAMAIVVATAFAPLAQAKTFLTQDEALRLAFPAGAKIERKSSFLKPEELERAKALAGVPITSSLVTWFAASKDGHDLGSAWLDTHVVRTLPETLLVVVDPAGTVTRIEVLSFSEPEDYLPRGHWYEQFGGKKLDEELSLKRGIRPVTGATLTARATTDAARRVLALHAVIRAATPMSAASAATAARGKP